MAEMWSKGQDPSRRAWCPLLPLHHNSTVLPLLVPLNSLKFGLKSRKIAQRALWVWVIPLWDQAEMLFPQGT